MLFKVLSQHLPAFLNAAQAHDGNGIPKFAEKELRGVLTCGVLAYGFAHFRCADCKRDLVVGLSCKGRGFCTRCGGRRMAERAAHLADHVMPPVQTRQWVLTLPYRLRYRIGYDHELCKRVLRIYLRALGACYRSQTGQPTGEIGCVTFIHRFSSGLSLSPHFHTEMLDGVFLPGGQGGVRFVKTGEPTAFDVAEILARIEAQVRELLDQHGLQEDSEAEPAPDSLALDAPALAACYAGSVTRRTALGPDAGKPIVKVGALPNAPWVQTQRPRHSHHEGFDLHASQALGAEDREGLERLLRYGARPAIAQDRLSLLPDGRVSLELKRHYHDGTTHLVFKPLAFIERLVALVPKPHKNLTIYGGVLAPNAKLRSAVVAYGRAVQFSAEQGLEAADGAEPAVQAHDAQAPRLQPAAAPPAPTTATSQATPPCPPKKPKPKRRNYQWAELMRRSLDAMSLRAWAAADGSSCSRWSPIPGPSEESSRVWVCRPGRQSTRAAGPRQMTTPTARRAGVETAARRKRCARGRC